MTRKRWGFVVLILGVLALGGSLFAKFQVDQARMKLSSPEMQGQLLRAELQQPGSVRMLGQGMETVQSWSYVGMGLGGLFLLGGLILVVGAPREDDF